MQLSGELMIMVALSLGEPLTVQDTNVSRGFSYKYIDIFLSDPSPIIGNACHSLTD